MKSTNVIQGRRRSTIPGDTEMILTQSATDKKGKVWTKGSIYQPQAIGMMGREHYQQVSIRANKEGAIFEDATFLESAQK